ncbi:MAG: hypothetical protein GKS07_10955 [Nitrosopumilus sp.]|nr:MAG: hypothetical protein GKS07_00520 [Nitrosopumilus sp.]QMU55360.1 MAG: hypothetical protein GKS07_10955 [Nitrosopumilus sp.]
MVLPLLIIGVILLAFAPQIADAVKRITSSSDPDVEKEKQFRELEKETLAADEGIFVSIGRTLFGNKFRDDVILENNKTPLVKNLIIKPDGTKINVTSTNPIQSSSQTGITVVDGGIVEDNKVIGFSGITGFIDAISQSRSKEVFS